jgi:hypothetical protein
MLVGNIATLRPLFRKMLRLGGSDSNTTPSKLMTPNGIPSNSQHPYKSFDHNYELNSIGGQRDNKGSNMSTQIQGGMEKNSRSSLSSDSDSQRNIFDTTNATTNNNNKGGRGQKSYMPTGIVVSRQINVSHSHSQE